MSLIRSAYILLIVGFLSVLLFEGFLYFFTNGDFILRFRTEISHYTPELKGVNTDLNFYPSVLFNKTLPYFAFFGYFFYFVLGASAFILLFKREKNAIIVLIWLFSVLLYMQYGSMNPLQYVLIQRIWRFLTIITIPCSLIVAYALLRNNTLKKPILVLSILIIIGTSIYYTNHIIFYMNQAMIDFRESAEFLKSQPRKEIYTDYDTAGKLDFLLGYDRSDLIKNAAFYSVENITDAYIVINASRGFVERPSAQKELPNFLISPPDHWIKVKVINESYYEVFGTYDTVIYYAPPKEYDQAD